MKHKNFNEILPYTYFIQHKETGKKYYGVRTANVVLGLTPNQDFSVKYFSSGAFAKDFKQNPQNYSFRLDWTFDSNIEAKCFEEKVLRKVYKREDWVNNSVSGLINFTDEIRQKMKDARSKITSTGETVAEVQARKVKESKLRIVDELGTTLAELSSRKASETMRNTVDENGNNILILKGKKAKETKLNTLVDGKNTYQIAGEAQKTRLDIPDENGITLRQKRSANMYKRTEDLKSDISRKRNEKYNIKLANMSDEDFEVFIEGKNSLWAELTRKRRIKAILNQQAGSNETC